MRNTLRLNELKMDWKVVTTVVVSTLLLIIDYYYRLFPSKVLDRMVLYFFIPLLIILVIYRERPSKYGLRLGDWRAGLAITGIAALLIVLIVWLVGRTEAFQEYYAPLLNVQIPVPLYTALDLFGWEFLFRGFLLFSLYSVAGPYAIVLQAVPFALAHLGKPEVETLSTIFGGIAFGYVAWRTGSFIYPFIIHWFLFTLVVYVAGGFGI